MKLVVMSDTHDNIWKLQAALPMLARAEAVVHCGDLCSPFMIRHLGDGLEDIPIHVVWGNNDGDPFLISRVAEGYPQVHLHGHMGQFELGSRKIAVNHYPEIARGLAHSRLYDIVLYGHDHIAHEEMVGECLLLNPGEVMGMNGRSSLAVVDLTSLAVDWIDLE